MKIKHDKKKEDFISGISTSINDGRLFSNKNCRFRVKKIKKRKNKKRKMNA